jgi:uncharacterized protein YjbJ (UPF0337 family)
MTSSARLQQEADVARAGLSSALDDLKNSVTTTALSNGAMTFAKEGSSAVAKAAVDRAMANPLATMLIGAGLFMLMSTRSDGTSVVGDLVDSGKSALKDAAGKVRDSASTASESASETAEGLADRATGEAKGVLAKGKEQAHDLTAKGRAEAQKLYEQGRGRFDQFAQEQPILVAALGVALGAAVGASLPITKAEQDYLGEAARKAKTTGGAIAQQVADAVTGTLAGDNVAHKVSEVVETATGTVKQGLRP